MKLKQIVDEVFGDYKECGMLLIFPECTWKCEGCQNKQLALLETREFPNEDIVKRFEENPFSKCIIFGGLEPLCNVSSINDIFSFITYLLEKYHLREDRPTLIIYTGYDLDAVNNILNIIVSGLGNLLATYENVIIKYGKYDKDGTPYFNETLGITLISKNQNTIDFRKDYFLYKNFNLPKNIS